MGPDAKYVLAAVINDPDGYTNVRSGPSDKDKLLGRIEEGEVFYTYPQEERWHRVKTASNVLGYVHSSRISLLQTDDSDVSLGDALYNRVYHIDDGEYKGNIAFYINPKADFEGAFMEKISKSGSRTETVVEGGYVYNPSNAVITLTNTATGSKVFWFVAKISKADGDFGAYALEVQSKDGRKTYLSNGVKEDY